MGVYSVRGFPQATGSGVADVAIAQLWNNDTLKRVSVLEVGVHVAGLTGGRASLARTTVRGTPNSTVTPDGDNAWDNDDVPPSGVLLDLAVFSTQPTLADPRVWGMCIRDAASVAGSGGVGFVWTMPRGFWVPPQAGLSIQAMDADVVSWVASEVYFVWEEG